PTTSRSDSMVTISRVRGPDSPHLTMNHTPMIETRDWRKNRQMWVRVLETQTGEGLDVWTRRIRRARLSDETALREWLDARGVGGYAQQLLVMERFGYP